VIPRIGPAVLALAWVLGCPAPAEAQAWPDEPSAALPDVPGGAVELSWPEIRDLVERLTRAELEGRVHARPPVPALVRSARVDVSVGDGSLLADAELEIEVLVAGWTTVPVFDGPAAIRYAGHPDSPDPVRLVPSGDGGIGVLLSDVGRRRIAIGYAVPVEPRMGPKRVELPVPLAGSVEVTFRADPRVDEVDAAGAVRVGRSVPDADGTTPHTFAVRRRDGFALTFVARRSLLGGIEPGGVETEGPAAPETAGVRLPRYRTDTAIAVSVDAAAVRAAVSARFVIHDAPVEWFVIEPLDGWELVRATVAGSDDPLRVEPEAEGLRLRFLYPQEDAVEVLLELERSNEERMPVVAAPVVAVRGAYRQEGRIGFRFDSTIEASEGAIDGGSPVDPAEVQLPGSIVPQRAFRFYRVPYRVEMGLRYHEPRAVLTAAIERGLVRVTAGPDGRTVVHAAYRVVNSRHAYLAVALPDEAEPWGAFVGGVAVPLGKREDRPGVVLIALPRPERAPGIPAPFVVEVTYFVPRPRFEEFGGWRFDLPRVDLPIASLDVEAFLPADLRYRPVPGAMRLVDAVTEVSGDGWRDTTATFEDEGRRLSGGEAENRLSGMSQGQLAARFEIPREGTVLRWHGAVFLPDEAVSVEVTSRPRWLERIVHGASMLGWLAAGMLLAAAAGAYSRGRRGRAVVSAAAAAAVAGAVVAAGLLYDTASPYLAFVGFAVAGTFVGVLNVLRWLGGKLVKRPEPADDSANADR
jgi:hypothetical protein